MPTSNAVHYGQFVACRLPLKSMLRSRQSTGFVLDPTGYVVVRVYSCGAIGQLVPEDVIELVRDLGEHLA
jgi:hypothetical protein